MACDDKKKVKSTYVVTSTEIADDDEFTFALSQAWNGARLCPVLLLFKLQTSLSSCSSATAQAI